MTRAAQMGTTEEERQMRTAAAFLLALGVAFGALLFAGLGTAPVLAQDVRTLDGDDGAWLGGDEAWFEEEGYGAQVEDPPHHGEAHDDEAGLHGEDAWWDWSDEEAGEVATYGADELELFDARDDRSTGDEGFDAWYGDSDELF